VPALTPGAVEIHHLLNEHQRAGRDARLHPLELGVRGAIEFLRLWLTLSVDASLWTHREQWTVAHRREEGGANPPNGHPFDVAIHGRPGQAADHSGMAVQIDRDHLVEELRPRDLLPGTGRTAGASKGECRHHAAQQTPALNGG
jgi:hypothetical protein